MSNTPDEILISYQLAQKEVERLRGDLSIMSKGFDAAQQAIIAQGKEIERIRVWCKVLYTDGAKSKMRLKGVENFDYLERTEIEEAWNQFCIDNKLK